MIMKTTSEKATEALDLLPEDMREPVVAYLVEQTEKFRLLKSAIAEAMGDVKKGNIAEWNIREFLARARTR